MIQRRPKQRQTVTASEPENRYSDMTGEDLRAFLDKHDLKQQPAARAIGIDPRTIRKYISGELRLTTANEFALRWLVHLRSL